MVLVILLDIDIRAQANLDQLCGLGQKNSQVEMLRRLKVRLIPSYTLWVSLGNINGHDQPRSAELSQARIKE